MPPPSVRFRTAITWFQPTSTRSTKQVSNKNEPTTTWLRVFSPSIQSPMSMSMRTPFQPFPQSNQVKMWSGESPWKTRVILAFQVTSSIPLTDLKGNPLPFYSMQVKRSLGPSPFPRRWVLTRLTSRANGSQLPEVGTPTSRIPSPRARFWWNQNSNLIGSMLPLNCWM